MKIIIDYRKCCWRGGKCKKCNCESECTGCAIICPVKAISRLQKVMINHKKCTLCGLCMSACRHKAISMA